MKLEEIMMSVKRERTDKLLHNMNFCSHCFQYLWI